ncbi:MAG: response regulator [Ardenticatenia bacterium]|nr:MAG: response regulator [Ardenticatenia bacterium]
MWSIKMGDKSIFILDDDPVFIAMIERWVRTMHPTVRVRSALTPEGALAMLEAHPTPTHILVDLHMPRVNGLDVVRQLTPHAPRSHFILITALPTDALEEVAHQAGIHAIVPKHQLVDYLDHLLKNGNTNHGLMKKP